MYGQLAIGSGLVALTIVLHAAFIIGAITVLRRFESEAHEQIGSFAMLAILTGTTLWLMASHSLAVWIWTLAFVFLDAFGSLEPALYFALISFTTLGFGDLVLDERWRILSGMTAASGLLLFGFSTAFLFELFARLLSAKMRTKP